MLVKRSLSIKKNITSEKDQKQLLRSQTRTLMKLCQSATLTFDNEIVATAHSVGGSLIQYMYSMRHTS
jgi:hypothetical protein